MNYKETKISVIIPTVNASDELDLCITSLTKNSDYELEIIVLVDPDQKTGNISKSILSVCKKYEITPLINQKNLGPYGSWNKGAKAASTNYLVFATDDQYFAPHWDTQMLKYLKPKRLVSGRLVEPGIIPVYKTNIQQDFGASPSEFRETDFKAWVSRQKSAGFSQDGFFIPMLQNKADFVSLGGYPAEGQFGTSGAVSNDYKFVEHARSQGYEFGTASDSYSYHFQASSWKKKTLNPKIAAVVLTQNSGQYLQSCLASLSFVDQIIVIDGGSTDQTLKIAKQHHAKVIHHDFINFATQRNFAISQATKYDWVLMIDSDEEVSKELSDELLSFAKDIYLDGVMIPRKNYIFGKWIEHTDWYPDLRLVFFRPKMALYSGDVHERVEFIKGNGTVATAVASINHQNYDSISEFVQKNLIAYPLQYARVLDTDKVKFSALDLLSKPLSEFMRRFFLCEGYKDGLYGLILSSLMAAQTLVAYCYLWEIQGKRAELTTQETRTVFATLRGKGSELTYWLTTLAIESSQGATKLLNRAKRKALKIIKGL